MALHFISCAYRRRIPVVIDSPLVKDYALPGAQKLLCPEELSQLRSRRFLRKPPSLLNQFGQVSLAVLHFQQQPRESCTRFTHLFSDICWKSGDSSFGAWHPKLPLHFVFGSAHPFECLLFVPNDNIEIIKRFPRMFFGYNFSNGRYDHRYMLGESFLMDRFGNVRVEGTLRHWATDQRRGAIGQRTARGSAVLG